MAQEQMAGITMFLIGLFLCAKPKLIWQWTEKWKGKEDTEPSNKYLMVLRILSGIMIGIGFLLVAGILK